MITIGEFLYLLLVLGVGVWVFDTLNNTFRR